MTRSRLQAGFTLAELLAGIAVAAILVLPLVDMLRAGTESARSVRSQLDLNTDARLAIGRIARKAAALPVQLPFAGPMTAEQWFASMALLTYKLDPPLSATVTKTNLVEWDQSVSPTRKTVIVPNVTLFRLTAPEVGAGLPLLRIELALESDGQAVARSRTVQIGGAN